MNGSFLSNIFRGAADDIAGAAARTMEPQLISDFLPRGAASEGGVLNGLFPSNRGGGIDIKHVAPANESAFMSVNGDRVPILDMGGPSKAAPANADLEKYVNAQGIDTGNRQWIDNYINNMTDNGSISKDGISINTDDAREMIKAVMNDPNILAHSPDATQQIASRLRRMVTGDLVSKSAENPRNFTFLGGGPGFGKGSAAKSLKKAGVDVIPDNSVIFDETLKDTGALDDWLQKILDTHPDNTVGLSLVMGNPADAFPRTISRAVEGHIKGTSRRTVPLEYAANAYNDYYDSALKALDMIPQDRGTVSMMDNRVPFGETPKHITDINQIREMLQNGTRTSPEELRQLVGNSIARGVPIYDKEARQILASGNLPDGIELINSGMGYDLVKLPEEILAGIDPSYKTSRF